MILFFVPTLLIEIMVFSSSTTYDYICPSSGMTTFENLLFLPSQSVSFMSWTPLATFECYTSSTSFRLWCDWLEVSVFLFWYSPLYVRNNCPELLIQHINFCFVTLNGIIFSLLNATPLLVPMTFSSDIPMVVVK